MAKIELQAIARIEPVVRPCLCALGTPPNPTANQIPIIGVAAPPGRIEIEVARRYGTPARRNIRVNTLRSKVHLVEPGNVRKVEPATPRGAVRKSDWRVLIIGITIRVEREPIA